MESLIVIQGLPLDQFMERLRSIVHEEIKNIKDKEEKAGEEEYLSVKQAAELLNLAVPTLYSLVSKSSVPVHKQGKRLYFSKHELFDWIKAGRKKTVSEIKSEANQQLFTKRKRG